MRATQWIHPYIFKHSINPRHMRKESIYALTSRKETGAPVKAPRCCVVCVLHCSDKSGNRNACHMHQTEPPKKRTHTLASSHTHIYIYTYTYIHIYIRIDRQTSKYIYSHMWLLTENLASTFFCSMYA